MGIFTRIVLGPRSGAQSVPAGGNQASRRRQFFAGGAAAARTGERSGGGAWQCADRTAYGSAVTEAIEALWRALGLEADRVVNDARQQFERDLKVEQAARTQAEAATSRTQEHLQAAQSTLVGLEKALASEQSAREQTTAALEQERLAHTRTDTQREAAQALAAERQQLRSAGRARRIAGRAGQRPSSNR